MLRIERAFLVLLYFWWAGGVSATPEEGVAGRRVMTWVPPYAMADSKSRLNESFDGPGMKDGITHLGLQFWNPTPEGSLKYVTRFGKVDDSEVAEFQEWGRENGVRVMLCVYNANSSGWDWDLAKSAFETNRAQFVEALVKETLRLGLDGVDIDLEGEGDLNSSKEAFVLFIKELSRRLHKEGKELSIDTFAYKWHAPRQSWWPELLPHIDGLNVMGYAETGANSAAWRSYAFLKAAAGVHASKLVIGMPGHKDRWQDEPLMAHLKWVGQNDSVGVAIWDARLSHSAWRRKETWLAMKKIKGGL